MAVCPWLTVSHSTSGSVLREHKQVYATIGLAEERATSQTPSCIAFIGKKLKSTMLRCFVKDQKSFLQDQHGQVYLWGDFKSSKDDSPILYIDCEMQNCSTSQWSRSTENGPHFSASLCWPDLDRWSTRKQIGNLLVARLLAPISTTLCYFAPDLGGVRGIAKLLAEQVVLCPRFDIPSAALPRAVVVVETVDTTFDAAAIELRLIDTILREIQLLTDDSDREELEMRLWALFHSIRVLGLDKKLNASKRSKVLRKRLQSVSKDAQLMRRLHHVDFSFRHIQAFTEVLMKHFCINWATPLNLISLSRPTGFAADELVIHLGELLSRMPSESWLWHFIVPLISSALLLASYPTGSHMFAPSALFEQLYHRHCWRSICDYTIQCSVQTKFLREIQLEFSRLFDELICHELTASTLHLNTLRRLGPRLTEFKSNRSCFCCLLRTPEKVLDCGHALCDECIKTFGLRSKSEKYTYALSRCMLCGVTNESPTFRFIPPTAGIRILCLDGGGIRGIIPLRMIEMIESQVSQLGCPLREYFDLVCGTSAGGLIVLGLFLMQWSPQDCRQKFERLAIETFRRRQRGSVLFTRLQELFVSFLNDSRYDASAIEDAFHGTFGSKQRMFNPLRDDTKVAVTVTTAKDTIPCLFSNYNGGIRPKETGYELVRAQDPNNDVLMSEAASSTSAAPGFFKAKVIQNLGTFQDGGLRHNNPLRIAVWESRFIWPNKGELDFGISLGTGTVKSGLGYAAGPQSPVKDRFISRLWRTFMNILDGENTWMEFKNSLTPGTRERWHRLNVVFNGQEPSIDDASALEQLKCDAERALADNNEIALVKDSLYASIFYFELDDIPSYDVDSGLYLCVGHILCRLELTRSGREVLYRLLNSTTSYFLVSGRPLPCTEVVPTGFPPFKRRVQFTVPSLEDVVAISLRGITSRPRMISGLPQSLDNIIRQQKLHAPFGRIDHESTEKRLPVIPTKRTFDDVE